MRHRFLASALVTGILLAAFSHAATEKSSGDFERAYKAFSEGDVKALTRAARGADDPDLKPYLDYFHLKLRIENASESDVQTFLERHAETLIANRLRADWLKVLAKQERWPEFSQHWTKLSSPDEELRCLAQHADLAGARVRPASAQRLLQSLSEMQPVCASAFKALVAGGFIDADDLWEQLRRISGTRRADPLIAVASMLPEAERPSDSDLRAAVQRPQRYLAGQRAIYGSRAARELALIALGRLASEDPDLAAEEMLRLENQLSLAERGHAWGQVAWRAAQQHKPEALRWYSLTRGAGLTDEQWQWWARAALREYDWEVLRQVIESQPARVAQHPTWVYWLGRSYLAGGATAEAQALFARIAGEPHFYGNLASEELGQAVVLPPSAATPTTAEIEAASKNPALRRALALLKHDMRSEGVDEWNWGLRGASDRQLLAAAELARRAGVYDRAISAANQTRREHDYAVRYLAPFSEQARPLAKRQNMDEAWIYGLMRQESRFIVDAKSSAGASGLMQLMPATARWVAQKIGLRNYRANRVTDPEINLMLGTSYLRLVLEDLDNHPVLASAAYNAGPRRARAWRDPERVMEGAIYAETIPFNETRDYVKKVMSNALYYNLLFTGQADSLKARLGGVAPAGGIATPDRDLP